MTSRLEWMIEYESLQLLDNKVNIHLKLLFGSSHLWKKHCLATFPVVDVPPCVFGKSILIPVFSCKKLRANNFDPSIIGEVGDHFITPA